MKKIRKRIFKNGKYYSVRGKELLYASNTLTKSEFYSFILSGLRRIFRFWLPATQALEEAKIPYKGENKRIKWEYTCNICKNKYIKKDIQIDHIQPLKGINSDEDIIIWIKRAAIDKNGFQILCKKCHKLKTNLERDVK